MSPRSYRLLPDYVRNADAGDLEAYLRGAEGALRRESVYLEEAATGRQVDPDYAPGSWLPWLARVLGANVDGLSEEQARYYLSHRGRSAVGSDAGLVAAIGATLTGSRYVKVEHTGPWEITVTLIASEVPDIGLTTEIAQRKSPAGARVVLNPTDPVTLADLKASYGTLADITATGKTLDNLRFG